MGEPLVLAVDLGTSGCKAAVIDLAGTLLATGRASVETLRLEDGGVEQDPQRVWAAVLEACRLALAGSGRAADVSVVAIDSQYSSLIPVDGEGRPTMNMILWQDGRGAPSALGIPNGPLTQLRWIYRHGIPPLDSGLDSLSHARFLALRRPEIYARTKTLLEPADYLA
ncbi:MAG: hypothetical protein KC431_07385, partial [Myxococcales bacterium]|nr:hypothetical protein [Myxococcales bacterium]